MKKALDDRRLLGVSSRVSLLSYTLFADAISISDSQETGRGITALYYNNRAAAMIAARFCSCGV